MSKFFALGVGLAVALVVVPAIEAQEKKIEVKTDLTVRGKVVKMEAPDRFVVRTQDNKEVILFTNPQTRYTIRGKAGRYTDLSVGTELNATYLVRDDRNYVNVVTVGDLEPAPAVKATTVEGTVVRVVGEDQVIVKTTGDKEVTVYVNPKTTYRFEDRAGKFTDVRQGSDVRIEYDVRDRRNYARSILGIRRKN
jgi:translation initiation factor IF-1